LYIFWTTEVFIEVFVKLMCFSRELNIPVEIESKKYYRTAEVCRAAGISKPTFFRWLREGTFLDARRRDMRGWRLFTREELDYIVTKANQINEGE
jgi:hypothetical protein